MPPRTRKPKTNRDEWGSITLNPNGRWRLRYLGPDGRRHAGGTFRTRAEAEQARAQLLVGVAGGTWRPASPGSTPTVRAFAEEWLGERERADALSPRTLALYRRQLDRFLLRDVGGVDLSDVPVGKLSRGLVGQWDDAARQAASVLAGDDAARQNGAAQRRREGHPARRWARAQRLPVPATGRLPADVLAAWKAAGSPTLKVRRPGALPTGLRQYEQARTVLSALCTAAVEAGHLSDHPVRLRPGARARTGHGAKPRVPVLGLPAALALCEAMPGPYDLAALLTLVAGLRGGETFALARRHLIRAGGAERGPVTLVSIERALLELPNRPVGFGPPKTGAGTRHIAIPPQVGARLATHAATVDEDPETLLFTTAVGRPVTRARRSGIMAAARTKVGQPTATWHTLRHTGLTLAASVPGTTIRNLMDRGGHSTPRAALIYQHTAEDADTLVALGLEAMLTGR